MIPAGRINKLFGTEGGVMLSLYTSFPEEFDLTTPLFVSIDALDVPLYCARFDRRGQRGAVVSFDDFDTERRAQELLGLEFRIAEEGETIDDQDEEFYMEDLIGFRVEASESGHPETTLHGTLTDYIDSQANPLFEMEFEGRHVLIPAAEEFFAHIDFEGRTMKLVVPEGLLNLE